MSGRETCDFSTFPFSYPYVSGRRESTLTTVSYNESGLIIRRLLEKTLHELLFNSIGKLSTGIGWERWGRDFLRKVNARANMTRGYDTFCNILLTENKVNKGLIFSVWVPFSHSDGQNIVTLAWQRLIKRERASHFYAFEAWVGKIVLSSLSPTA